MFLDKLVFPRFVMPLGKDAILTMESNQDEVWKYTDTNGDSIADKKELFTTSFGRSGNVEHQQSSLFWGLDNWLYSTYNAFRVRWTPNGVLREPTAPNNSQWGITQDSTGRIWFQGGASGLPGYFQLPIHYGLTFPAVGGGRAGHQQFLEPGFEVPWGIAGVGDYQPGTSAIRPGELTLRRVTGAAGNDIVRAHRMPDDLQGDYLYGEPVARIVRRVRPVHAEGLTTLRQVYQEERSEFIRSSDHLFRPVDVATAPDGTIYVVDPYRGIIQEGNWTRPGSYLRAQDRSVQAGRQHPEGPDLARELRRDGARHDAAASARRDAGAARLTAGASQRLVARHRAAAAGPEAGPVGGARAAADGPDAVRQPVRTDSCVVDARGSRRARPRAGAREPEGSESADADPGDPRQRDALQGRPARAASTTIARPPRIPTPT